MTDPLPILRARRKENGAELAITYLNDKSKRSVEPLAEELGAEIFCPATFAIRQLKAVFDRIADRWGKLDFVLHSVPSRRARIFTGALSTVRGWAFNRPWISPVIRSSA